MKLVEMHFLADVYVPCEVCRGKRFNEATLRVQLQGQEHRRGARHVRARGDGALRRTTARSCACCRRSTTSASGTSSSGSPRRRSPAARRSAIKLSRELARVGTGRTLYILDEPTTGLHFEDIRKLLHGARPARRGGQHGARHRAQPRRHQERRLGHRPRARRAATAGGRVIAEGTPEEVAEVKASFTGHYLGKMLRQQRARRRGHEKSA